MDPDETHIVWGPLIRIRIRNLDPDPGGQKWTRKMDKNYKFHLLKSCPVAWTSLWRPRLIKLLFFILKKIRLYFFQFWSSKPWIRIRIRIHLKCWIRIHSMKPNPKHCREDNTILLIQSAQTSVNHRIFYERNRAKHFAR